MNKKSRKIFRCGSIADLSPNIDIQTYVALQNAGIETINALKQCAYAELLEIEGLSNVMVYSIAQALEQYDGTVMQGVPQTVSDVIMLSCCAQLRKTGH